MEQEREDLRVQLQQEREQQTNPHRSNSVPSFTTAATNRENVVPLSTTRGMQRVNSLMRSSTTPTLGLNLGKQVQEKERGSGTLLTPRSRGGSYTPRSRDGTESMIQRLSQQSRKVSQQQPASALRRSYETGSSRRGTDKRWK
eukprot:TRINITY_DN6418_c0_g1_i2.p2 TRINITY_DN6418_c0_g1~~TRINITY_DN6418_c0_g1_i2.p2  ORF type:complete len:143 (-),score=20.06 TRINITY_DN6418_c0_g1_i2:375-803(-)